MCFLDMRISFQISACNVFRLEKVFVLNNIRTIKDTQVYDKHD